jgi:hypothetical protein
VSKRYKPPPMAPRNIRLEIYGQEYPCWLIREKWLEKKTRHSSVWTAVPRGDIPEAKRRDINIVGFIPDGTVLLVSLPAERVIEEIRC